MVLTVVLEDRVELSAADEPSAAVAGVESFSTSEKINHRLPSP
jgi:hypothetical protein